MAKTEIWAAYRKYLSKSLSRGDVTVVGEEQGQLVKRLSIAFARSMAIGLRIEAAPNSFQFNNHCHFNGLTLKYFTKSENKSWCFLRSLLGFSKKVSVATAKYSALFVAP